MDIKLFYNNQQSIKLSYEIVESFRKQDFYIATSKLTKLLGNLDTVAGYIFSQEDYKSLADELQLILPALLDAQDNCDYFLQADIIEGDLLPLLQKIQIAFQERDLVQVPDFFERNMIALKQYDFSLYRVLDKENEDEGKNSLLSDKLTLSLAINGQPTAQAFANGQSFYLHSSVNPEREARLLADSLKQAEDYIVFGMELGYHVLELLNRHQSASVCVFESNIYMLHMAFTYIDWTTYIANGRMRVVYNDDLKQLVSELSGRFAEMKNAELLVHYPAIKMIEDAQTRQLLEDFFVTTSSMREQGGLLDSNFEVISKLNLPECGELKDIFKDKAVVIVGAGPSVDSQLDRLRKYRDKITVFATGHITRRLVNDGIIPDAVIITDPQPLMYKQIDGVNLKEIPMILLSTASSSIVEYYNGPIYVAYQSGYAPAEIKAGKIGSTLFETGGSVTTTALDIALRFGAGKIIFVGVDLAYTGGYSHASGEGRRIENTDGLRQVRSNTGGMVYTSKNLDIYRKWIERRLEGVRDTEVYNTGDGAEIKGTVLVKDFMSLRL